jgi:hypothetical protein
MSRRVNWGRVAAITGAVPLAVVLLCIVSGLQGDTDLPPYDPPNTLDLICWVGTDVLAWPAKAAAALVGFENHQILVWSLFWLSGLFWAGPLEALLIAKNARRS